MNINNFFPSKFPRSSCDWGWADISENENSVSIYTTQEWTDAVTTSAWDIEVTWDSRHPDWLAFNNNQHTWNHDGTATLADIQMYKWEILTTNITLRKELAGTSYPGQIKALIEIIDNNNQVINSLEWIESSSTTYSDNANKTINLWIVAPYTWTYKIRISDNWTTWTWWWDDWWVDKVVYLIRESMDLDWDWIINSLDLDSDNDWIPDNIESQETSNYIVPSWLDDDNDWLDNAYEWMWNIWLTPINTDQTDTSDYLDLDSDNEWDDDTTEAWLTLSWTVWNNWLDNWLESTDDYSDVNGSLNNPLTLPNLDWDNLPDYRDDTLDWYTISGTIWFDENADQNIDTNETTLFENIKVSLYKDENSDWSYDINDSLIMVTNTLSNGSYTFGWLLNWDYLVIVDTNDSDLNNEYYPTTSDTYSINIDFAVASNKNFWFELGNDTDWDWILDDEDTDDDNDWISDVDEIANNTNPLLIDTDWNWTNDGDEDTDWDWATDWLESDETSTSITDINNNWIADLTEAWDDTDWDWILNIIDTDDDNDWLLDTDEIAIWSNPLVNDTDWDWILDNVEWIVSDTDWDWILDILESNTLDTDNDWVVGQLDSENNNPNNDSDNDWYSNNEETEFWTDPLDDTSYILRADVNNSWLVTSSDAMLTLQKSVWIDVSSTPWVDTTTTWDVTCDSNVASSDAMLILQYSVWINVSDTSWCDTKFQ